MKNLDIQRIKLKYLLDKFGFRSAVLELRCSTGRVTEFLQSNSYPLPNTVQRRLDKLFRED